MGMFGVTNVHNTPLFYSFSYYYCFILLCLTIIIIVVLIGADVILIMFQDSSPHLPEATYEKLLVEHVSCSTWVHSVDHNQVNITLRFGRLSNYLTTTGHVPSPLNYAACIARWRTSGTQSTRWTSTSWTSTVCTDSTRSGRRRRNSTR